jgi:biotin carboxyl carrier protein
MKKLRITVNGKAYEVDVEVLEDDELIETQPAFRSPIADVAAPVASTAPAPPQSSSARQRGSKGNSNALPSPINGTVLEIAAQAGQEVNVNEILFIIEAMKMKTNIASPRAGRIASIDVRVRDTVSTGQVLLTYQ